MKIKLSFIILIFYYINQTFSDENNNIIEYQLLWLDLKNANEVGYKSHFNSIEYILEEGISKYVKKVIPSNENNHFIILNQGFFKILLENDTFGYTRSGEFHKIIDEAGNLTLRTKQNYLLADPIILYMDIIKGCNGKEEIIDTIIVDNETTIIERLKSHSSAISNDEYLTIKPNGEKIAKQLKVYNVPYEHLQYFKDAIYTLKNTYHDEININEFGTVHSNMLEQSNTEILPILIRMYYLLSIDETIKNSTFKTSLIKTGIDNYAQEEEKIQQYIQSIVPFIQYEY
jgi:flagellar basal body rod protein FlgG